MALGEGKYDDLCTLVRERAKAHGAIVLVLGGEHGSGFSVQADLATQVALPDLLETMASMIRADIATQFDA